MTFEYTATLAGVVDGDTVDLTIDLGFRLSFRDRFRLAGCNAPEKRTPEGKAAALFVRDWFADRHLLQVRTLKDSREKYGRWLATIIGPDGADLVTDLIAAGHAVPWDGQGPRPVATTMEQVEPAGPQATPSPYEVGQTVAVGREIDDAPWAGGVVHVEPSGQDRWTIDVEAPGASGMFVVVVDSEGRPVHDGMRIEAVDSDPVTKHQH
ncbi:MAG TPA: thermonuclease family protein [Kineosporiaceae bacterium]|nr:thermonuclease family protein [Kineosporiaceae bacterium]